MSKGQTPQIQVAPPRTIPTRRSAKASGRAIPADDKPYMRVQVAKIIVGSLRSLNLSYPKVDARERARFDEMRRPPEQE